MEKMIINPSTGLFFETEIDGVEYEFKLTSYENVDGYAKILVIDKTNDERYISNGYIELNNHIIISKWNKIYSHYRDNWICSKDLIITIQ